MMFHIAGGSRQTFCRIFEDVVDVVGVVDVLAFVVNVMPAEVV